MSGISGQSLMYFGPVLVNVNFNLDQVFEALVAARSDNIVI
jgi:hypothetical protein